MKHLRLLALILLSETLFVGCGGVPDIMSTPIENIDNTPIKEKELTDQEKQTWGHLDLVKDTIPGMSVDKAYAELLSGKQGRQVVVAVIDSGIDIDHEDLDGVVWKNSGEIAGNGKDDDNNGYVDDINGWNFLGDAYDEQLEMTRIVANKMTSHPGYAKAQADLQKEKSEAMQRKTQYEQILQQIITSDEAISRHLGKQIYTLEEVSAISTQDQTLAQHKNVITQTFGFGIGTIAETKEEIKNGVEHFTESLNYNLNTDFRGRTTGDNVDDITDKVYGNGNVKPVKSSEDHGTHVAGIIAAERNNGKGANGVANNVRIMSLRAVPNGDEYDKDIALAIRYAVDNGASIINASFGKSYSTHSDWVHEALKYAERKDVLFVHAAGNDGQNNDFNDNFPNDNVNGNEISGNYISVGALDPVYGSKLVSDFSNYGNNNVDVFAPGGKIYSTLPDNKYKSQGGTSMAAPAVAGVAALIRSYYPKLKASEVKKVIMDSGLPLKAKVIVAGDSNNVKPFANLSKSGKSVNAYNALVMAAQLK